MLRNTHYVNLADILLLHRYKFQIIHQQRRFPFSLQMFRPQVRRVRRGHPPPRLRPQGPRPRLPPQVLQVLRLQQGAVHGRGALPQSGQRRATLQGRLPQDEPG